MVLRVQPACFVEKSVIWGVDCDCPSVMQLETVFKKTHILKLCVLNASYLDSII